VITFNGAAKKLQDIDLPRIGAEIGVGEDEIHAILDVESAGSGFDTEGRPKALYEPHIAYRLATGASKMRLIHVGLAYPNWGEKPYPRDSYPRILAAQRIDETVALMATSWGLGQILGQNYKAAGYTTPQSMVTAFCDSEAAQLEGVINFIKAKGLANALRTHNWVLLARGYNGAAEAAHGYHTKLSAAFRHWQQIPDTPYPTASLQTPASPPPSQAPPGPS
jgi:hypothetical protein